MYEYAAKVLRVIDGDTVELEIDLGFSILHRLSVRLKWIDAPELFSGTIETRKLGLAAKIFLESLLPLDGVLIARTTKDRADKYGRILVELFTDREARTLNSQMIDAGHAVPYDGGKRS